MSAVRRTRSSSCRRARCRRQRAARSAEPRQETSTGKESGGAQRAVWWQFARLGFAGLAPHIAGAGTSASSSTRRGGGPSSLAFSSRLACRHDAATADLAMDADSCTCRARRGIRVPVSVTGIDRIPRGGAVMAFNHASYTDAVVVAAVLPGEPIYVAKKELARQVFAGPLLRRLGVLFLERYEIADSLADLEKVSASRGKAPSGVLSRGHIHAPGRSFRFLSRRL